MMKRREFITLLGGVAAAWPVTARAQPAMPVIGFLYGGTSDDAAYYLPAFRRGLREMGYIEGRNMAIEFRWAEDRYDRVSALAEDLVRLPMSLIIAIGGGGSVAKTAKAATTTIPIVFISSLDPVESGLVASLNSPGGNATGISLFGSLLEPKKLELLHEVVAEPALIAMLMNPNNPNAESGAKAVQIAADALGRRLAVVTVTAESEIEPAFLKILQLQAGGLIVAADPFLNSRREQLVALATRNRIAAIYEWREFVQAGGLMSYGSSLPGAWQQVGVYVGRILKGEKPRDLPVQQPTK
ncbi:MAG TPA: ABC transporter substrate-binding protein, partial [Pirellulales bacterium]|nr:ABC transporter substrate-binding protein [Pirellulales bacterium]